MYQPPDATAFNRLVWEIVRQIPAGKVSTYGQVASIIPTPEGIASEHYAHVSARWVGAAMRLTPEGKGIPWHRVINSQGKISPRAGGSGAEEQRRRLEEEGVMFDEKDRVDFELVGWEGPSAEWLIAHGLQPPNPLSRADSSGQMSLF